MMSNPLIRTEDTFKPRHIVIVGNGALSGGWEIVERAIKKYNPFQVDPTEYNALFEQHHDYMLASVSFTLRLLRELLFGWLYFKKDFPLEPQESPENNTLVNFTKFIQGLNDEFSEGLTAEAIKLRPHFDLFLNSILASDEVGIITTNWDELLWKNNSIKNIIQLHGRVTSECSHLLLPTEICMEENTKLSTVQKVFDETKENLLKTLEKKKNETNIFNNHLDLETSVDVLFKNTLDRAFLNQAHRTSIDWLENANKITFYGINHNLYDAELNTLLLGRGSKKQITVINPSSEPVYRVAALLKKQPRDITHICP